MDPAEWATILDGYEWTQRLNYLGISGFTVLLCDFLHTFPDEVRLMWPQPLSPLKALFLFLRYYIMGHMILLINYGYPTGVTTQHCTTTFIAMTISSGFLIVASEWVLFIRVWAFSGRNKKVLAFLGFQAIAIHGATKITLVTLFIRSVRFSPVPFHLNMPCLVADSNDKLLSGTFGLLLWGLVSIMSIMIFFVYQRHRHLKTKLLSVFYRDGVFYFVCLSMLATVNIVVNTTSKARGFKYLFTQIEVISHVILSTRMLIHLRLCAEREAGTDTQAVCPSTMHFKSRKPHTVESTDSEFTVASTLI
ncbi:hypothetical protein FA13DRAFT_479047 [Coprinellus micaceus]|uniref:DUF6533 domain-containing protein n=1 Tax=Coprinellus micaceus TaxID=71717 RepID=A0A4Y7TAV9_COPMI|nr:hypothetical protein FA13DRAFT_479047 [Coprinellus micaceus]